MGKLAMPSTDVGVTNNGQHKSEHPSGDQGNKTKSQRQLYDSCGSGSVEIWNLFQNLLKQLDEQRKQFDQQNQSMQEKFNNLERKSKIEADQNRALIVKLTEHMQIGIIVEKDKEIADKEKRIKELEERMDEKERQSFWSDIVEAFKKQKRKMKGKRDREDTYLTTMD